MRVDNVARYDAGPLVHDHVVCRACGTVADVPRLLPDAALGRVEQVSGYLLGAHPVQFTGVCPACAGDAALRRA
jgi:Fe2+ or Zn2+ uptake regulation protein